MEEEIQKREEGIAGRNKKEKRRGKRREEKRRDLKEKQWYKRVVDRRDKRTQKGEK